MKSKRLLIGISVFALVIAAVISTVFFAVSKFNQSNYPTAPPMPPAVSQSMEEILVQLEGELRTNAPDVLTNLRPGLSMDKIDELEKQAQIKIPADIKAIYHWRDGYYREKSKVSGFQKTVPMPGGYFMPLEESLETRRILNNQLAGATLAQLTAYQTLAGFTKTWLTLFDDGGGDGYFYDPDRRPEQGAIFSHDMEPGDYTFFSSP